MKKTILFLTTFASVIGFFACSESESEVFNPYSHENLFGEWRREALLVSNGQYDSIEYNTLTIAEDGKFNYVEKTNVVQYPDSIKVELYRQNHQGYISDFSTANVKSGKLLLNMTWFLYRFPSELSHTSNYNANYDSSSTGKAIAETAEYEWLNDSTISFQILGGAFTREDIIPAEFEWLYKGKYFDAPNGTAKYILKKQPSTTEK